MTNKEDLLSELNQYRSDELKLEFLEKTNKQNIDIETKKLVLALMADIYIKKRWWNNAAQSYSRISELCSTFDGKINAYLTTAKTYIKAEQYIFAEDMFKKALILSSQKQRPELKQIIFTSFLNHAQELEKSRQLTKSIKAFHKVLEFSDGNQDLIKNKLAELYEKIGRPQEATRIRSKSIEVKELPESRTEKEVIDDIKDLLE